MIFVDATDALHFWFEPILDKALKRGKWILGSAVVLLGLAVFIFSRMGGEFVPQLDEGDIAFHAILKPGSSLTEMIETTTKIEGVVKNKFPEVQKIVSRIGVAEVPTDPMPMDLADIFVILAPKEEWVTTNSKDELVEMMKEELEKIPGVNYEFTQPIEMRFNELLEGVREDIAIKLYGEDINTLATKAEEISKIIAGTKGIGDLRVEATTGLPQMTVRYNRHKLAQYGVNVEDLNTVIQYAFAGGKAGVIFEGEKRFDLVVRLDEKHRRSIDDLKNLYVNLPNGSQIPLKEVASISYQPGPMQISRDNTNRRTYVGINVRGRDIKSLVEEIQQKLNAQLELPPGYYIRYGGAFENLERASERLKIVVPIALALIFLLIFFALRSFKQSMMIYMAIPLAAIGGIFSLWLRDMPFSISAGIGFIVLFGVAVLNGLVLISGWNELKEEGNPNLNDRIRLGARRRIRPILLTALTDVLGFLPMAISTSAGAEVQQPLATVVIGAANVTSIKVIEGDKVSKGQVLAYLSHPDLIKLQTDYFNSWNQLQYLEKEYQRQKKLYEEKVGSGKEYQKIQSDYQSMKGNVNGYEAQLKMMGLGQEKIKQGEIYEQIPVPSPISGHIRLVEVKTGQYVQPQTEMFEIVNINHIHADLMVFEKDMHKVKEGQKVRFSIESLPDKELEATIYAVGKSFEQDPKAIHLHAEIENKEGLLIPGMYVRGRIMTEIIQSYALPEAAVVREGEKYFIFTAKKENDNGETEWAFEPVEVIAGAIDEGWIEVKLLKPLENSVTVAWNNAYYLLAEMKKGEAEHNH